MDDLTDWKAPPFPPAKMLEGRYCRLEPLDPDRHLDDLWSFIGPNPGIWAWMPAYPPSDRTAYRALLCDMAARKGIVPFAVVDLSDRRAKGHLWLMEIRPEHGVFEVGYITYSPSLQRTRTATEAIHLCGEHGFSLGYRRFEWKCNNLNEPSKQAARRFGFRPEGVFRQHMVVKGHNRDTAWFSILDHEWPARSRAFRHWLEPSNFDADGKQITPLSVINLIEASPPGLTLRQASLADRDAILAVTEAAYLPNEAIIGVPSLPRIADYREVIAKHEVWLAESQDGIEGVLVLEVDPKEFTIWSLAVAPAKAGQGLGRRLMSFAEERAAALGFTEARLYTHEKLVDRIAWYGRLGYEVTHHADLPDRRLTYMRKTIEQPAKRV